MTQNQKLAKRLDAGKKVTNRYATKIFRVTNLSARICELRDANYNIQTIRSRKGTFYKIAD